MQHGSQGNVFHCYKTFVENSWGESHVAHCIFYTANGSAMPGTRIWSERCNLTSGHAIKARPADLV